MVNGTVTLSLAEVDKLRADIEKHKQKADSLEKELTQVKADKRVVKITKYEDNWFSQPQVDVKHMVAGIMNAAYRGRSTGINAYEIERVIYDHLRLNTPRPYNAAGSTSKTEYVNFEDVRAELRKEAEDTVASELGLLRQEVSSHVQKIASLKEQHRDKMVALKEQHEKNIQEYEQQILELEKKYDDLLNDKDTRTREQQLVAQIEELEKKLEKEKEKSWLSKLTGR